MGFCTKCGAQIDNDWQAVCDNCNGKGTYQGVAPTTLLNQEPTFSMKWYKFLIYFALFFAALLNLANGVNYITGGIYEVQTNGDVNADMVYLVYEALKPVDVVFGLAMIGVAAFAIYTRMKLAKFKADGPNCLYILYAAGAILTLIYNIVAFIITGETEILSGSMIGSFITSGVMIALNYVYFNKRKALFVK